MQRSAGIYLGNIQNKSSGDSSTDAASAETIASNMSRISDFSPESARCAPSHPTNAADALQELMSALGMYHIILIFFLTIQVNFSLIVAFIIYLLSYR